VYAVSWWRKDAVDEYLRDPSLPIWKSLQRERRELYREIVDVQLGYSAALQEAFGGGVGDPMWARTVGFDVGVGVGVGVAGVCVVATRCSLVRRARDWQYVFWHDDKPLTVIHEIFSNRLDRYLGPTSSEDEDEDED